MSQRAPQHDPFSRPVRRHAPPERDRQAGRALATNSAEWRRIRERVLIRDLYTCQRCARLVGGKGEAHVDHVDGDSSHNPEDGSNWQALCVSCHSKKTAAEDGGFGNTGRRTGARPAARGI